MKYECEHEHCFSKNCMCFASIMHIISLSLKLLKSALKKKKERKLFKRIIVNVTK